MSRTRAERPEAAMRLLLAAALAVAPAASRAGPALTALEAAAAAAGSPSLYGAHSQASSVIDGTAKPAAVPAVRAARIPTPEPGCGEHGCFEGKRILRRDGPYGLLSEEPRTWAIVDRSAHGHRYGLKHMGEAGEFGVFMGAIASAALAQSMSAGAAIALGLVGGIGVGLQLGYAVARFARASAHPRTFLEKERDCRVMR